MLTNIKCGYAMSGVSLFYLNLNYCLLLTPKKNAMSKHLFQKLQSLKGGEFVGIRRYTAKTSGEVANHTVNLAISVETAKKTDLALLQSADANVVAENVSLTHQIALEICKTALNELRESAVKNVSSFDQRTVNSKAQTDAYFTHPDYPGIRINKASMEVHIFGLANQKKVITPGTYKKVNSAPKTIAKKLITKELDLRAGKFRTFIVGNINQIRIQGDTITMG